MIAHRIHVLTRKEDVDPALLPGKVAVVFDVLFATSTMVNALAQGAAAILPVADEASARAAAAAREPGSCVLAGELDAVTLPGFAPPTPLALAREPIAGRTVIHSTTNGTVALRRCAGAAAVYAGALLNADALARHLAEHHRDATLLLVCAGSMGHFNLEDFCGAGYLVDRLLTALGSAEGQSADLSDAARAARSVYLERPASETLLDSRVGRMFVEREMEDEVRFCARRSALDVVARMEDGVLTARPGGAPGGAPR